LVRGRGADGSWRDLVEDPEVDAIHTFRAQLASQDPTVSFVSDSGRSFGVF